MARHATLIQIVWVRSKAQQASRLCNTSFRPLATCVQARWSATQVQCVWGAS